MAVLLRSVTESRHNPAFSPGKACRWGAFGQKDLSQYFGRAVGPDASSDSAAAPIPAVVTDVGSAFLRLRAEQHVHTEDSDFHIVKDALGLLRNPINKKGCAK